MLKVKEYVIGKKEIWKEIDGYNGKYDVSSHGKVRSYNEIGSRGDTLEEPWIMALRKTPYGYPRVSLHRDGIIKTHTIHRLVAEAFIPNPENKPCVNHIDGNPENNNAENLEWCTYKENTKHAIDTGLFGNMGESHNKTNLTEDDVLEIRAAYNIGCFSYNDISEGYDIVKSTVSAIINNKSWKHI